MSWGGGGFLEDGTTRLSLTGLTQETWNVGWILVVLRRWRRTAARLIILIIGNGRMYFGANLRDSTQRGKSFLDSQTLVRFGNRGQTGGRLSHHQSPWCWLRGWLYYFRGSETSDKKTRYGAGAAEGWGRSEPAGRRQKGLLWEQTGQAAIYLLTSLITAGHPNCFCKRPRVRLLLGWQVSWEVCPQWITWERSNVRTNRW